MSDSKRRSTGLVGRAGELARLRAALGAASAGRGSAVLISGEAGIGKTRLVAELADAARGCGAQVLSGRCIDLIGPGVPYYSLLEALRSVSGADRAGDLPDLIRLVQPDELSGHDGQLRLFERVQTALDRLASAAPVVLVLEDLHWADGSTLDFLVFLSRLIRDRPMLLLATYRSDEMPPGEPLARTVVELVRARDAEVIELSPLTTADVTTLLEDIAGQALPADLTEAIVVRSGGNPFFAEELLAAADRGEPALPRVLRVALLQRISRVDPAGHTVLRIAAAFGRDVPHRMLEALADAPDECLEAALRQAVEHGVLVADRAAGSYRFRHALLGEAVYETILPGEAVRLHERIARTLTDRPQLAGEGAGASELARHWVAADRPAEALVAAVRAAREAESVYGLAEASRHLEWVLRLWPDVPGAADLAGADEVAMLTRAAELADLTGRSPRAAELVGTAIELVDEQADPVRAGHLLERLGSYLLPTGERSAALDACRRAVDLVPARPPTAERARALTTLGNALMLLWRHDESREVCVEALATAEALGDPRPALRAQGILGIDHCYLGRPVEGRGQVEASLAQALALGTPRDIAHSHAMLCEVLIAIGCPGEAIAVAVDGRASAHRLGVERSFGALLAAYAAEGMVETGEWDRADALLTEAHRAGGSFWAHYPRLVHAQLATARGRYADARHHLTAGAPGAHQPTSAARYARVAAELAMWEGRPDEAVAAVDGGLTGPAAGRGAMHDVCLNTLGVWAQVERAQRALDHQHASAAEAARSAAREHLAAVRRSAAKAASVTPEAAAWRARAEAEATRLADRPDTEPWRIALAAWEALRRPYHAAYARWRLVEALLATASPADRGEATGAVREAHRIASDLGAAPLRRALAVTAQGARLDLKGLPPLARPDPVLALGLTKREGEVLRLLTRGYTNREIATELTISVKTASVHVSHILQKLGVPRRINAAAIGQRLRVADGDAVPS